VLLFSLLALQVKRRAPTAHTFLEIIRSRWGKRAHIVFLFFALMANVLVTSMLILGGSAVTYALTGMNTDLASFLIPLGVFVYTLAGGLKATFIASYLHTVLIMVALCLFMFKVYATDPTLGSPSAVWDRLQVVHLYESVPGNAKGSFLTISSIGGFMFGIINIVGNFGAVFVDQAYWQSAIAATPSASWKGYILGGLSWFSIPFTLATALGIAAVAFSLPISVAEANAGLVPIATAQHMMGSSGSILILIMLFMAITSAASAEQIAVSSIVAFDIFRTYINPKASGAQIVRVSRWTICIFGTISGSFSIILNHAGIDLGWLYLAVGVLISSAVFPVAFSITWTKCSSLAAISGAIGGLCIAVFAWTMAANHEGGAVSIATLGSDYAMLIGNVVALLSSGVICTIISLIKPDNATWETTTMAIKLVEEDPNAHNSKETEASLQLAFKKVLILGSILSVLLIIVWPLLTLPAASFSKPYFNFWVVLSMIWGMIASAVVVLLPIWEYRQSFFSLIVGMLPGSKKNTKTSHSTKKGDEISESSQAMIAMRPIDPDEALSSGTDEWGEEGANSVTAPLVINNTSVDRASDSEAPSRLLSSMSLASEDSPAPYFIP
jgi:SSS family transporter